MKINPPWYFECGWWSPWCFLDEWWHRLFDPFEEDWPDAMDTSEDDEGSEPGWLCRKHDRAVEAHYYRRHPEHVAEDGYVKK